MTYPFSPEHIGVIEDALDYETDPSTSKTDRMCHLLTDLRLYALNEGIDIEAAIARSKEYAAVEME